MAWPPEPIAADKANSTTAEDDHAPHHNALAGAINDLVAFGPAKDVPSSPPVLSSTRRFALPPGTLPLWQPTNTAGFTGDITYWPFLVESGLILKGWRVEVAGTPPETGSAMIAGVFNVDTNWQPTGTAVWTSSSLTVDSTGPKTQTISDVTLVPGRYMVGRMFQANTTLVSTPIIVNGWTYEANGGSYLHAQAALVGRTWATGFPSSGVAWTGYSTLNCPIHFDWVVA